LAMARTTTAAALMKYWIAVSCIGNGKTRSAALLKIC
jgi:hypothetical protein